MPAPLFAFLEQRSPCHDAAGPDRRGEPAGGEYSRPRDRAAGSARAASRGRREHRDARQRAPHRREHGAHPASLYARGCRSVPGRRQPVGPGDDVRDRADRGHAHRRLRARTARRAGHGGLDAGARLLARRALLGPRLRHRGGARADRPRLHRSRARGAAGRCPRHQSGLAAGAGEMRLPVDRGRALPHPRAEKLGADRPLPARRAGAAPAAWRRRRPRGMRLPPPLAGEGWGGGPLPPSLRAGDLPHVDIGCFRCRPILWPNSGTPEFGRER